MMTRHHDQLREVDHDYGHIDMLSWILIWAGPKVWPKLRQTVLELRQRHPDLMLRARGIGNYGDYFTPERVVPGRKGELGDAVVCDLSIGVVILL